MNAIKIIGLTKEYGGRRVVDRLDLAIPAGELFALLGVNGAGKSTTIKMLSCLTVPTDGDAQLMGRSVRTQSRQAKEILAVSPQETAVAPNLSVAENLELMAEIYGRVKEATARIMDQLCEAGVVGGEEGTKPRKVLMSQEEFEQYVEQM